MGLSPARGTTHVNTVVQVFNSALSSKRSGRHSLKVEIRVRFSVGLQNNLVLCLRKRKEVHLNIGLPIGARFK